MKDFKFSLEVLQKTDGSMELESKVQGSSMAILGAIAVLKLKIDAIETQVRKNVLESIK